MRLTIGRAILIVVFAICLGLIGNSISPRGIPLGTPPARTLERPDVLSLQQAKVLWDDGTALFIDAREPADYRSGHIANAFNLPALSFDAHFNEVAPMLTPESRIVVYCDGLECELSHQLSERLKQTGYLNVQILLNGWTDWRQAGFPTESSGAE